MRTGPPQPSIVIDVHELVAHAESVATMERDMGNPSRVIRAQVTTPRHTRQIVKGRDDDWTHASCIGS
ncbi:MAG: hypothetical protein ACREOH_06435 [Candidatus Entotheonellia bacterium]